MQEFIGTLAFAAALFALLLSVPGIVLHAVIDKNNANEEKREVKMLMRIKKAIYILLGLAVVLSAFNMVIK